MNRLRSTSIIFNSPLFPHTVGVQLFGKPRGYSPIPYTRTFQLFSEESNKKHPFPCPTTYRTALLHYVDIASRAKGNVVQELIQYAQDPKEKEFLEQLTSNSEEGKVSKLSLGECE